MCRCDSLVSVAFLYRGAETGDGPGEGLVIGFSEILVPGSYGFALRDESPAGPFDGLHPISADGKIVKNL